MKNAIFAFVIIICLNAKAQKFYTSSGVITFTSEAPMETVIASNKQVTCMMNTGTKDIAFKVIMKSFRFEKQGMYDHFNDTYLHTDKYPNATFEGNVTDAVDLSKNGNYNVTVDGKLTIHGVTKPV